jgi:hypothetical protein
MRKALTDKVFIITVLLAIAVALSSYIVIKKTDAACTAQKCNNEATPSKHELMWDAFPAKLITSAFFR